MSKKTSKKPMIKIVNFDLIPTEYLDALIWYFPEVDPFSLNFETAGLESVLFLHS